MKVGSFRPSSSFVPCPSNLGQCPWPSLGSDRVASHDRALAAQTVGRRAGGVDERGRLLEPQAGVHLTRGGVVLGDEERQPPEAGRGRPTAGLFDERGGDTAPPVRRIDGNLRDVGRVPLQRGRQDEAAEPVVSGMLRGDARVGQESTAAWGLDDLG